ncbi:MAG: ATP-binding protein [Nitrospiraceae bacterium]|nr:ATP-binding protein [Nitrospirota bacterium]MDA8338241.1 ATP-binding protein [Nitrospiraceae bacterium]
MDPIKVGKFTLESLTTGMYADPRIIFREYIQNATDAIDRAIKENITKNEEGRIDITINKQDRRISIKDNGSGIHTDKVWQLLGDIGNSQKRFEENRGFRGIGRLGGLSYASELQFITSAKDEGIRTIVYWDCKKLRELIQPGKYMDYDLAKVMDEISFMTTEKEADEKHYFEVILDGIDEKYSELLDLSDIEDYLSQVAPVPFNAQRFPYYADSKEGIESFLKTINKPLEEYNIYLNGNPNPVYKPYKTWFHVDKKKDDIKGIEFFKAFHSSEILFWGWYAKTNWLGTVEDENIKGLRVRKNNILIGDRNTLDDFFTETRFNGWIIGEVYVYDSNIIPNARRDNFEKNEAYKIFRNELEKITRNELSKIPKKYSKERTERKDIEKAEEVLYKAEQTLEKGITSEVQRKELFEKIDFLKPKIKPKEAKKEINSESNYIEEIARKKEKIYTKLIEIESKIIDADIYRVKDIPSSYPKDVRKVVSLIFEVIDSTLLKEDAEKLIDNIIEALQKKPKDSNKNEQKNFIN